MKKKLNKSELGSVMIEALAMLALIALVTPMLYKKSAERTTELQDINAAGEMRAIIKAVDDYISANYDAISQGKTVTANTCASEHQTVNYSDFADATEAAKEVDLGHFCEFLPYGILNADGDIRGSRMFSDYKVVLKIKGTPPPAEGSGESVNSGDRVVTGFVITEPQADELPTIRASSIASMIGGNGGFVSDTSGEDESATGTISGNLGIWGVSDTREELGVSVKKGAVVAASIQGISSQNAKIDLDGVLYRKNKPEQNHLLNTMATTLYMGAAGSDTVGNDIVNIGHLAVGAENKSQDNDALYIKSGDIRIGTAGAEGAAGTGGNIILDGTGNITLANGGVTVTGGDLVANASDGDGGTGGNLIVSHEISAAGDAFQVAADAAVTALSYVAGTADNPAVSINTGAAGSEQSTFKQPVEVEAEGDCSYNDDTQAITGNCALKVKGNSVVSGDFTVGKSFSAKDLHAREKLTVGQNASGGDKGRALTVISSSAEGTGDTASLNFGKDFFKVYLMGSGGEAGNIGYLEFSDFVNMTKNGESRTFDVGTDSAKATSVKMQTDRSIYEMTNYGTKITGENGVSSIDINSVDATTEGYGYYIDINSGTINLNNTAFRVFKSDEKDKVLSSIESFKIRPESSLNDEKGYFEVRTKAAGEANNAVDINSLDTYMTDGNQYIRNGTFHLQKGAAGEGTTAYSDGLTMKAIDSLDSGGNPAAQVNSDEIYMKGLGAGAENVVKFDLARTTTANADNVPVYVRKGAIELTAGDLTADEGGTRDYNNYVKGEYFVSTKQLENNALINGETETHYQINPGYTSVMHDIKLTTRGGARLSDILPDFINKGIYVVDNTYPAKGVTSCGGTGLKLSEYEAKGLTANKGYKDLSGIGTCTSIYQEVSPWGGFVPSPTCPPGYSKVITMVPASISMAQAGIPFSKGDDSYTAWKAHPDLSIPYVVKSPYDYLDGTATDAAPTPLYYQKNTWLKSFADKYCEGGCGTSTNFRGWDVGMGFIYPYNLYKDYIDHAGGLSGSHAFDYTGGDDSSKIIWNMFPVYAGTLEGYATVYCYFNRKNASFNPSLIDSEYDQIDNYRNPTVKADSKANTTSYINRLNDNRGRLNAW